MKCPHPRDVIVLAVLGALGGGLCLAATPPAKKDRERRYLRPTHEMWRPTLSDDNRDRVLGKVDRDHISFFLSDLGRWSKAGQADDARAAARYAFRKVLNTQIQLMSPDVLESWRETGWSIRSRRAHGGEEEGADAARFGINDIDVGLRSAKPFVGTNLVGTRLTLSWDWRRDRTILAASRHFGPVSTRFEIREGRDRELRFGITIPLATLGSR
ncbi:MAG: hypothetical protein U0166_11010 [Acidobacteriota bacterium]